MGDEFDWSKAKPIDGVVDSKQLRELSTEADSNCKRESLPYDSPTVIEVAKILQTYNLGLDPTDYEMVTGKKKRTWEELEPHEHDEYLVPAREVLLHLGVTLTADNESTKSAQDAESWRRTYSITVEAANKRISDLERERDELKAEVKRLHEKYDHQLLVRSYVRLREQLALAIGALEECSQAFYKWEGGLPTPTEQTRIAGKALAKIREMEGK